MHATVKNNKNTMQTIKKTTEHTIADDVAHAIAWLESEYPHGVDLVYIDYRDSYDENIKGLAQLLREGYDDTYDNWQCDAQYESIHEVIKNYTKTLESEGIEDISEDVQDAMREWLYEHDTSTIEADLLRNARNKLFFVETNDYITLGDDDSLAVACKTYTRTDAQKKAIEQTIRESSYDAPVSFYFYLDPADVFKVLHGPDSDKNTIIVVDGACFSSVDRIQGSNWLSDYAIFKIALTREQFLQCVHLDEEDGTGYGWGSIAGQTGYDDAGIAGHTKIPDDAILLDVHESEHAKTERARAENWQKTHTCMAGDMNIKRHKNTEYINSYPCGLKCKECGTFWID